MFVCRAGSLAIGDDEDDLSPNNRAILQRLRRIENGIVQYVILGCSFGPIWKNAEYGSQPSGPAGDHLRLFLRPTFSNLRNRGETFLKDLWILAEIGELIDNRIVAEDTDLVVGMDASGQDG